MGTIADLPPFVIRFDRAVHAFRQAEYLKGRMNAVLMVLDGKTNLLAAIPRGPQTAVSEPAWAANDHRWRITLK